MKIKNMNMLHFLNEKGLPSKRLVLSFIIAFFLGLFIPAIGACTEDNIGFDFSLTGTDPTGSGCDEILMGSVDGKDISGSLYVCVVYTYQSPQPTDPPSDPPPYPTMHFLEPIWRIDADDGYIQGEASGIIFDIQMDGYIMTARLDRVGVITSAGGSFADQRGNRVHSIADLIIDLDPDTNVPPSVEGETKIIISSGEPTL